MAASSPQSIAMNSFSSEEEGTLIPNKDTTENATDELKKEKARLIRDIEELKTLNFQMECCLNISKFGNVRKSLKLSESLLEESSNKITDVLAEYKNELFQLAGMHCPKFIQNESIFMFDLPGSSTNNDNYMIQLIRTAESLNIGKWSMPMSIDVNTILQAPTLDMVFTVKPFLADCKHHIACYMNRLNQYNELQDIMIQKSGCSLDTNLGYTLINLKFLHMHIRTSDEFHNISLDLVYEINKVHPYQINIDLLNSNELSSATMKTLLKYFNHFKCSDLKTAFEATVGTMDPAVKWPINEDQERLNLDDSSASSLEDYFEADTRMLKRKSKHSLSNESSDHSDSHVANNTRQSLVDRRKERGKNSNVNKVKRKQMENKQNKVANTASRSKPPQTISKSFKLKKGSKKLNSNTSKMKLRQGTLEFQVQKPKETAQDQLCDDTRLTVGKSKGGLGELNTTKERNKSNGTVLKNHQFCSSTPVRYTNEEVGFATDNSSNISTIH